MTCSLKLTSQYYARHLWVPIPARLAEIEEIHTRADLEVILIEGDVLLEGLVMPKGIMMYFPIQFNIIFINISLFWYWLPDTNQLQPNLSTGMVKHFFFFDKKCCIFALGIVLWFISISIMVNFITTSISNRWITQLTHPIIVWTQLLFVITSNPGLEWKLDDLYWKVKQKVTANTKGPTQQQHRKGFFIFINVSFFCKPFFDNKQ